MDVELLKAELRRDEGEKLKPYEDTKGKLTIGVGHNLSAKGISPRISALLLEEDINDVFTDLDRALPWWIRQTPNRQRALANLCFNLGVEKLLTFKLTLDAWERGDWPKAAECLLNSRYARQVGKRAQRVAALILNG